MILKNLRDREEIVFSNSLFDFGALSELLIDFNNEISITYLIPSTIVYKHKPTYGISAEAYCPPLPHIL